MLSRDWLVTRNSALAAMLLAGCAQQTKIESPPSQQTVAVLAPSATTTTDVDSSIASPMPTAFEYPADLGGRAVESAVAPDRPALPAPARFVTAPQARILPARLINPDSLATAKYIPPPILPAKPVGVQLVTPPERVPNDLGNGAGQVPAKPTLPKAAPVTQRSRDVNLPPPLPTLGKPLAERVSLDDPTAELGNAAIANPVVKVPLAPAPFLKVAVADPFELGEQVKPKVAPSAEPGLTPVTVNPRRVK